MDESDDVEVVIRDGPSVRHILYALAIGVFILPLAAPIALAEILFRWFDGRAARRRTPVPDELGVGMGPLSKTHPARR